MSTPTSDPRLPIDLIPNTDPPQFRWQHRLAGDGPVQVCEGCAPPSMEGALVALIRLAKQQDALIREMTSTVMVPHATAPSVTAPPVPPKQVAQPSKRR